MTLEEMVERARNLRRQGLFRVNHAGLLLKRMQCPSLFAERPLRALCEATAPPGTFNDLSIPLLVSTLDVARGTQVVWGLPGLRDVRVADAVYAAVAFPGLFPAGRVGNAACVDGAIIDNLPADAASHQADAVIAVDLGGPAWAPTSDGVPQGFFATYAHAAQLMMQTLQTRRLADWSGPPLLVIRPAVWHHESLSFPDVDELVAAGHRAASAALDEIGDALRGPGSVYPRDTVHASVDRETRRHHVGSSAPAPRWVSCC
jgi:NTE family protein